MDTTASFIESSPETYPYRFEKKMFIVNIAGSCNLRCPYCFIGRREPSNIDKDDFKYIFHTFGENIHFVFGGIADFFCGYRKEDRLLEYVLAHDVTIHFDFNGVLLHELPEIPPSDLEKIRIMDVSYHYSAMKKANHLSSWIKNVRKIAEIFPSEKYYIKMIISLKDSDTWNEAITLYNKMIYPYTKQKLFLFLDSYDDTIRRKQVSDTVFGILARFENVRYDRQFEVVSEKNENFWGNTTQCCPGGSRIFKVENTGQVKVCNYTWSRHLFDLGNVKSRDIRFLGRWLSCRGINNPSCFLNMSKNYNLFPEFYGACTPPPQAISIPE